MREQMNSRSLTFLQYGQESVACIIKKIHFGLIVILSYFLLYEDMLNSIL